MGNKILLNLQEKDVSILKKFPTIKHVYRQYNTVLPSSAAVERLFSKGSLVITQKRTHMDCKSFEIQLLLNANKHLK